MAKKRQEQTDSGIKEAGAREESNRVLEKGIVALFLLFVIVTMIFLFRQPPTLSGKTVSMQALQLDKFEYNASERIKGLIILEMDKDDVLPEATQFEIFIETNVPECQLKYICPNGIEVDWHRYDAITGQCLTINPDPESLCCLIAGKNCGQIILNSKFNAPLEYELPSWFSVLNGVDESAIGIEDFEVFNYTETKTLLQNALFLDTSYSWENKSYAAVKQMLTIGNRQVTIKDLMPSETRVELSGPSRISCFKPEVTGGAIAPPPQPQCNNQVDYTATMYLYGQRIEDASYSWANTNNSVGILLSTTGRIVTFRALSPGTTTIQVTASYGGETVTTALNICVYLTRPEECPAEEKPFGITSPAFKFSVGYVKPEYVEGSCAFEVIVKGKTGIGTERNLHYWYDFTNVQECSMPQNTSTDKYISLKNINRVTEGKVTNYSINLPYDWIRSFGAASYDDVIIEIWLVSHGKSELYGYYSTKVWGQRVYFDNVELRKYGAQQPSIECPKKCCVNGTGLGNYLGEQFSCEKGRACYDNCAFYIKKSFAELKTISTTPNKFNVTRGKCRAVVDGNVIDLIDHCYEGAAGLGFTACLDTSNTSKLASCRNWDNRYVINLSYTMFNLLKAPPENGSYKLKLVMSYNHKMPYNCSVGCLNHGTESCSDICVIHEISVPFSVGVPMEQQCPDPQNYGNCVVLQDWSDWSTCTNGKQTRTRVVNCSYLGSSPFCPRYQQMTQEETRDCAMPCDEEDYNCSEWQPALCAPQSNQNRNCILVNTECNPNDPASIEPITTRLCSYDVVEEYVRRRAQEGATRAMMRDALKSAGWSKQEIESILNDVYGFEEEKPFAWWLLLVIVVVLAVIVVLLWKFALRPKPKAKPEAAYPELVSYIKDALAAGATKQEIVAKLQEAGWPKDAIEASFKEAQKT